MSELDLIFDRSTIIAFAIAGAVVAIGAPFLLKKLGYENPGLLKVIVRFGHSVSWVSVGLFIAAGFMTNL